ncbi:MAG: hypothetical protein IKM61_09195 [Eubacteriaceae bacterium]|nr:hypothetical protein [Eubacteriaceae bacterium]
MSSKPFLRAFAATVICVLAVEVSVPFLILIPINASPVDIIVALVDAIPFGNEILKFTLGFMGAVASMTNSFFSALGLNPGDFGVVIPTQVTTTHFFAFEFLKAVMVVIIAGPIEALIEALLGKQSHGYFNKYANTLILLTTVFLSTLLVNRVFDIFQSELVKLPAMAQNILLIVAILIVIAGGFFVVKAFLGSFMAALVSFFVKNVLLNLLRAIVAYMIAFCVLIISGFPNAVYANPFFILALFGIWWLIMILEGIVDSKIANLLL